MRPEQALDKIAELGQQLMLDKNPDVAFIGAAILALPITASEDIDELNELTHLIFCFIRTKSNQKEAIRSLLEL